MKWSAWTFSKQGKGQLALRRYLRANGKKVGDETYPTSKWKHLDEHEREALLRRLNASHEASVREAAERYTYDHAFINPKVLKQFESKLELEIRTAEHRQTVMATLHDYTFEYFVRTVKMPDPNLWKRYEGSFGIWLQAKKLSAPYMRRIVQNANRFLAFLHDSYFEEIRSIKLSVSSRNLAAQPDTRSKFITPEHFNLICENADPRLVPLIKLGYWYGLRRAETVALTVDCVFEDYLHTHQQLKSIMPPTFDQLKTGDNRKTPHWNVSPEVAYHTILGIVLLHPDTISHLFASLMEQLKLPFQFHDLRRTFITNAMRDHNFMDVRLAAGHKDLETTQKYIQDDRRHTSKKFTPRPR